VSSTPERLPTTIPASAFLRAGDRRALEGDRTELYVVHVDIAERDDSYGHRCLYWMSSPGWPAGTERVLDLAATVVRRRQLDELRLALRRAGQVGPFRLIQRRIGGRPVWALVAPTEADAQLELGSGDTPPL
jgi:hypothetical protein